MGAGIDRRRDLLMDFGGHCLQSVNGLWDAERPGIGHWARRMDH